MNIEPSFNGEVQFRRYSDTSTQGQQIVFSVPDREALEPFIGKEGKRYMAVLVEIGDDEQPVAAPRKDTRGPLCREACDYCEMPAFQEWAAMGPSGYAASEAGAKEFICAASGVTTRKDLDVHARAADAFIELVRVPFMRWQRERKQ